MSACYCVDLKIKIREDETTFQLLKNKINRGKQENTNYSLQEHKKEGLEPNSLDHCIRIFLADWKYYSNVRKKEENGFSIYYNDFNASYGWGSVIIQMFEELSPYLEKDSELFIDSDDGITHLKITEDNLINYITTD